MAAPEAPLLTPKQARDLENVTRAFEELLAIYTERGELAPVLETHGLDAQIVEGYARGAVLATIGDAEPEADWPSLMLSSLMAGVCAGLRLARRGGDA